jgi:hypothetical protein
MSNENIVSEMKSNLGKSTKILVSFDTTGSMSPAIKEVRQKIRDLMESMTQDIPELQVALIAHGDYCDGDDCIRSLDFTNDLTKIMAFISDAPETSGGDSPECYEFALHTAANMSWGDEGGSVILIGDDLPHEKNPNNIDWRNVVKQLAERNIQVIPVQCLYREGSNVNKFWSEVSELSNTPLLKLESFNDSANVLEAVAYASAGDESYTAYMSKVDDETMRGLRSATTSNMVENTTKLCSFAKSRTKE